MRHSLPLLLLLAWPMASNGQAIGAQSPVSAQARVEQALANELRAAQDTGHPMRYELRKTSPRLTSTKRMIETGDGLVARLVAINDKPLNAADEKKERDRLDGLLSDPGKQRHRKQSEDQDAARVMKVLRALPAAFLYHAESADAGQAARGRLLKFAFEPNPAFDPGDLETQVLKEMTGEIWIDEAADRVIHLEGHLQHDVDYGWGLLGRLNKGGWIAIEQADVGGGQWRMVRLSMKMNGRVFLRTKVLDTTEEESAFAPVAAGITYQKGIEMLRAGDETPAPATPR